MGSPGIDPNWVLVIIAGITLVGGGIWATVNFFASKAYADAMNENLKQLTKDFFELKELFTTHISNEIYYRQQVEKRDKMLDRAEEIFGSVEEKLRNGTLRKVGP